MQIKRNAPRTEQLAAVRDAIPTLFPDRTSVDSVQRNNFTLALLDCVIALVEFGHYSTFDPRSASFGPDFAAIQQVLIPFLFVPQPCRKMAWPAMPIACAGRDLSSNMPVLVAQLVPSLLKTLDGRGDVCAPFGNFSAEEARFQVSLSADLKGRSFNSHPCSPDPDTHAFELRLQLAGVWLTAEWQESEKTLAVMHAKLKALQILHSFFRSAESERITRSVPPAPSLHTVPALSTTS